MRRSFILQNIRIYIWTSYALVCHRNRGEERFRVYLKIVKIKIAQAQRCLLWAWAMAWYKHWMLATLKMKKIYSALLIIEKTIKHGEAIPELSDKTYIHYQCERYYESLGDYTFPFLVIHEPAGASQRPEVPGGEGWRFGMCSRPHRGNRWRIPSPYLGASWLSWAAKLSCFSCCPS